ncbi:MAG: methyltransferase [Pyrinomonadaceae bacterium]
MESSAPQVTPEITWRVMTGFQMSAAFKAAVELELFTKVGEGNKTAADIAQSTGAAERGIRILADTMTVAGLLKKSGSEYSLTDESAAFLDKCSKMYVGSAVDFLMGPTQMRGFEDFTNAVRHGGSQISGEASLDPESPMWVTFARSMMPLMMPSAQMIAGRIGLPNDEPIKVLDMAAGHGIFGVSVAMQYPKAEIYAADWKNVLTVATENAERFGVADRHHLIPGSAFESDFGDDYDVVLVTNFLHHFDPPTNIEFLRKVHAALKPGGRAFTLEFVPNDDRVSPPSEALFSMVMLAATPAGDAYTFRELDEMFTAAGFFHSEHIPLAPMPQHLIVSTK